MAKKEPQTVRQLYAFLIKSRQRYVKSLVNFSPEVTVKATEHFNHRLKEFLVSLLAEAETAEDSKRVLALSRLIVWWQNALDIESLSFDDSPHVLRIPVKDLQLNWNAVLDLLAKAKVEATFGIDIETRLLIEAWLEKVSFMPEGIYVPEPIVLFKDFPKILNLNPADTYAFLKKTKRSFEIESKYLPKKKKMKEPQNVLYVSDARIVLYEAAKKHLMREVMKIMVSKQNKKS